MSLDELFEKFECFNADTLKQSSRELVEHINSGGTLFVTIAGALSSAGIGKSLSPLINQGFISGISCTGANLEEDLFRAYCGPHEKTNWRELTSEDDHDALKTGKVRVTDMLFNGEKLRSVSQCFAEEVIKGSDSGEELFPHEYCYRTMMTMANEGKISDQALEESWLYNAQKKGVPVYVPGWEDSTFSNHIVALKFRGEKIDDSCIKSGMKYMEHLIMTYIDMATKGPTGFFQLGGGIAGDFPICVVPLLGVIKNKPAKVWDYFCQISESRPSYGGYSGAPPSEKITWGKLSKKSKTFVIESDASIVAPLVFHYVFKNVTSP